MHLGNRISDVFQHRALGQFKLEARGIDGVLFDHFAHLLDEPRLTELPRTDVDCK